MFTTLTWIWVDMTLGSRGDRLKSLPLYERSMRNEKGPECAITHNSVFVSLCILQRQQQGAHIIG